MRFDKWGYLYPPRPDKAVSKSLLSYYANQGWIAQIKMNGTNNVMSIAPDRKKIVAMSRHNDEHKLWAPSAHTIETFANLPGDGWYVFVAELMHSKVPGIRDINYIHDVLVADGEHLVGQTYMERQTLLRSLFNITEDTPNTFSHYVIDDHTWLAKNHTKGFLKLFESLDKPQFEGLVVKNPDAKLVMGSRETANNSWQIKCRRPMKNFGF